MNQDIAFYMLKIIELALKVATWQLANNIVNISCLISSVMSHLVSLILKQGIDELKIVVTIGRSGDISVTPGAF